MIRTLVLLGLTLFSFSSAARATPFSSRPSRNLPECGGQAGLVASNFGPKLVLTRIASCSNISIDGQSFKMYRADDGLYYFEMSLPDWDDGHQIYASSNSKHTRDGISFRGPYSVKNPSFPVVDSRESYDVASAIGACQKAFYDQKNSLTCVDFAKRNAVTARTIESCGKVLYNSQSKLRCVQANRLPKEVEACGVSYGGEDSKVSCIERYAKNKALTPEIVRACITTFSQADFQLQCIDSAPRHRTAALQVIKSCETNYYGDSQRMVCMKP